MKLLIAALALFASTAFANNITMVVGQSYTYDLNTTVPSIPVGVQASVTASIPTGVQITRNPDNTGSIKALVQSGGNVITYAAPGYTSVTDMLIISNPPPGPSLIVVRGAVGTAPAAPVAQAKKAKAKH